MKPYLVIPYLVEQPTWGGNYIVKFKNWNNLDALKDKKIGQSYELYGKTKLATSITDSTDPKFRPEGTFVQLQNVEFIHVEELEKIPLLIKFTQALGNSFQIHLRQDQKSDEWKPKAESWYYLEKGYITFGIKTGINLEEYKKACKQIEAKMKDLSQQVKSQQISYDDAKSESQEFIHQINPWQYVNRHYVEPNDLIDLSPGGLQHSWEEDRENLPLGNVLYEIQQDIADEVSTLRSFDQGKMQSNGDIREITIDDFFTYIDTDETRNDVKNATRQRNGQSLLTTPYYCLDIIEAESKTINTTNQSFSHLFMLEGDATIRTDEGSVRITKGHSCFVPKAANQYEIIPSTKSTLLKTFIE